MQNKKLDCVLLSVPVELLAKAGIEDGDVIQMYSENGKITISAQKEPEKYKNLRVRVTGFSDYFVKLQSSVQQDIIERTSHNG